MPWDYEQTFPAGDPEILSFPFTASILAISVSAENRRSTWYKSGYLQAIVDVRGIPFRGRKFTLEYGDQLIEIPYSAYSLRFEPVEYAKNTQIRINELLTQEVIQLMPLYNDMPKTIADQPVTDSVPTSFAAPQYLAATLPAAYQALAPNTSRQKFAIRNKGTAPVNLDLDAPTSATSSMVVIPANGVYVSDIDYQGAVFVWSSNATSQQLEVREFLQ